MLPTFVSNLFWGSTANKNEEESEVKHTTSEAGEWLVISTGTDTAEEEEEKVETESVASDYSWVVEPCPRFRTPSSTSLLDHSMENLLIEHPTMSVYAGHTHQPTTHTPQPPLTEQEQETVNQKQLVLVDRSKQQLALRNQNRAVVLYRNQARMELAKHMGLPLHKPPVIHEAAAATPHPKEGKKLLNKRNATNNIRVTRGKKSFKIQKCGVKAGRRRC